MGSLVKGLPTVCHDQAKINAQVNEQENQQKEPCQGHYQFFSD
jgi:hypothetical protein